MFLLLTPEVKKIPLNTPQSSPSREERGHWKLKYMKYFLFVFGVLQSELQPNNSQHVHSKTLIYLCVIYHWIDTE